MEGSRSLESESSREPSTQRPTTRSTSSRTKSPSPQLPLPSPNMPHLSAAPLSHDECRRCIRAFVKCKAVDIESAKPILRKFLEVNEELLDGSDESIPGTDYVPRMRDALRQAATAAPGHANINTTAMLELFDETVRTISKPEEEQAKHNTVCLDNKVCLGVGDRYFEFSCDNGSKRISEEKSTLEQECEKLYKRFTATGTGVGGATNK